jgi:hypothetical protein
MNIAPAYDSAAGINSYNRKVALNKINNQVIIKDTANFINTNNAVEQVFMTVCKVDTLTKGVIKLTTASEKKYQIIYNPKKVKLNISYPSMEGAEYSSFKSKWNNATITRITLMQNNIGVKESWQYIISAQKEK